MNNEELQITLLNTAIYYILNPRFDGEEDNREKNCENIIYKLLIEGIFTPDSIKEHITTETKKYRKPNKVRKSNVFEIADRAIKRYYNKVKGNDQK